jgi:hypothetical protein
VSNCIDTILEEMTEYGKIINKEITMEATETKIEHKFMTIEEKAKVIYEAVLLFDEGKDEEASQLIRSVPMPPSLAKNVKEIYGADLLLENGYNLLEANKTYGKDWLYK